jgi:hypothetical protein
MSNTWRWIFGIAAGLIITALLFGGMSDQQGYWVARGTVPRAIQVTQVEDITLVRFPCRPHRGSIETAKVCGFYVWKR